MLIKKIKLSIKRKLQKNNFSNTKCLQPKNTETILVLPINGKGLGHLTRCLAITNRLREILSNTQYVFLTTSIALPIIYQEGYFALHVPPNAADAGNINKRNWNLLFKSQLDLAIKIYRPKAIIFDGSKPYLPLKNILKDRTDIKAIWIRRGLFKNKDEFEKLNAYSKLYDLTIIPGELSSNYKIEHQIALKACSRTIAVSPMIMVDESRLYSREKAASILNISPDKPTVYVQLGAGNVNDIAEIAQQIIEVLNRKDFQVVFAESPIAKNKIHMPGKYSLISDYPNTKYYNAFDIGVSASGYNSTYEALHFGLPTIFFPNSNTILDDQMERANVAQELGLGITLASFDRDSFADSVDKIYSISKSRNREFSYFQNGAIAATRAIIDLLGKS